MMQGKSKLNPDATPYVPLSKFSTGISSEKASDTELGDYKRDAAERSAENKLPDSISLDYDIESFEKLNISEESSSNMSQLYYSDDSFNDDLIEFEKQSMMADPTMMLESLSSMFPDIAVECLAELLAANHGDFSETIDVLQQLEYGDDDGSEYPFEAIDTSSSSAPASGKASASGASDSI